MVGPRAKQITPAVQGAALVARFPDSRLELRSSELIWTGHLTPTELSDSYEVRVRYRVGDNPKLFVLEPVLQKRDGKRCDHMYADNRPCLYRRHDWDASMMLADTIVPWASEWLAHYEVWLATGDWTGRGEHPKPTRGRELKRSRPTTVTVSVEPQAQADSTPTQSHQVEHQGRCS